MALKHIKNSIDYHYPSHALNERSLEEAEEELKAFQHDMDLNTTLRDVLKAMEAIEIAPTTLLEEGGEKSIEELVEDDDFIKGLRKRKLRASDMVDTSDSSTFIKIPLRYVMITTQDATDLDDPVYMLLQYSQGAAWSKVKLYYVQGNVEEFYARLSTVTMTVSRKKDKSQKWVYVTSNSGEDWVLRDKKTSTETFKEVLDWNAVQELSASREVEVVFN
jgi:hypothetical protein